MKNGNFFDLTVSCVVLCVCVVCVCVCVCCVVCVVLRCVVRPGRGDLQPQLDSAMQDVSDKYLLLEETEKQAVRKALVEERSRFCCFVSMLRPVVVSAPPTQHLLHSDDDLPFRGNTCRCDAAPPEEAELAPVVFVCQEEEMSMLGEITHLQTLTDDLKVLTMDPHKLPASSEQVRPSESTFPL